MRIAYDFQAFSAQQYGGISRYFTELATRISFIPSTQVEVISPVYINSYLGSLSEVRVVGQYVPPIKHSGGMYNVINRMLSPVLLEKFHPDLVHETYYSAKSYLPSRSKSVLTVFDMIHERFPECFPPGDKTASAKAMAVERADHIFCISENTRQDLVHLLNVPEEKTSVVYLGVSAKLLLNASPSHPKPYILYVGSRKGYKNFEKLLQAYASSNILRADYDLIAFGGGEFNSCEQALIQALGISADQILQVSGDDSMLARFYSNAAIFVYPSQYEGFGLPPLEAMLFNCPVACSNTSSIPEVVGSAAYFFDPYCIESIAYAIENVLNNTILRTAMIAKGQEQVNAFSWQRCAQETAKIYQHVISYGR